MTAPLTVEALFDAHREKLALTWVAGRAGLASVVTKAAPAAPGAATHLVGHMNFIRPNVIQILGRAELRYLQSLDAGQRMEDIARLFAYRPAMVIVADHAQVSDDLAAGADGAAIPLLASELSSDKLITHLHYYLTQLTADRLTLHGVFMEVLGVGVLITGSSGVGKSELALELMTRGHRLIADDAPEFTRIAPDIVSGICPEMLRDFLEVRGLGLLNIRAMFGDNAVKQKKNLRLIVHLVPMNDEEITRMDRLRGNRDKQTVLDVEIPRITLPVAPGRNLAVMLEAAVRDHVLSIKGYNAADLFIAQQERYMRQGEV